MNGILSVAKDDFDMKIINTINRHQLYPHFQMLGFSAKGDFKFDTIFAKKMAFHTLLCASTLYAIHHFVDLSKNEFAHLYIISFFMMCYLLSVAFHILNKKEEIIIKDIFQAIEKSGEKGTLVYFLASMRLSSFVSNKKLFTESLEKNDYKYIYGIFKNAFEVTEKENKILRPTTPFEKLPAI